MAVHLAGPRPVTAAPTPTPASQQLPAPTRRRLPRDVFIDATRALATVCVVLVHWLMPEASWDGSALHIGNALDHGYAWALTWVLQPLPLLFFAAGAAAAYQRTALPPGRTWSGMFGSRLTAVARPVAVFAGTWAAAVIVLLAVGVPDDAVWRLARMAPQLLWFLAVWVALLTVLPALQRAWRRWRWAAIAVAAALPLAVDLLRFGAGADTLAWANVVLVWVVPFLAGVAYATDRVDGRRSSRDARTWCLAGVVVGIAAMALLVAGGPYPLSMIGMPGDAISNLGPPTAPIVGQALAQVSAVLLARGAIARWASGRTGRGMVQTLSRRSMTIYLWHLTAMFAVVGVVLLGLDARLPEPWSGEWWVSRPTWLAAFLVVLVVLVRAFGRFEVRRAHRTAATASISTS